MLMICLFIQLWMSVCLNNRNLRFVNTDYVFKSFTAELIVNDTVIDFFVENKTRSFLFDSFMHYFGLNIFQINFVFVTFHAT